MQNGSRITESDKQSKITTTLQMGPIFRKGHAFCAKSGGIMHLSDICKQDLVALLECAEYAIKVAEEADFRALIRALQKIVPTERCMGLMFHVGCMGSFQEIKKVVNVDYPEEWLSLYVDDRLIDHDPIARRHFERYQPQIWSETLSEAQNGDAIRFIDQASAFGLSQGITVGLPALRSLEASLFSFQGDDLASDPRHLVILQYLTPFLHHSLSSIGESGDSADSDLSKREKEILRWILAGKINWEIAVILRISERTVKFHIQRAMLKLGAASRSHLLAIALKRGMIEL